jgi:hypothetical protein
MSLHNFPTSLPSFMQTFATSESCADYLFAVRWPQGFVCETCGSARYSRNAGRDMVQCKHHEGR